MSARSDFNNTFTALIAKEAAASRSDPERMGSMIERLSASLGMTIALATNGDPAGIDTMVTGCEAHIHAEAVDRARVIRLMNGMGRHG